MAVKPVIIPLVADTTGLQPGIDALEELGKIDKDSAAKFREANKAFQERGKVLDQSVTSTEKFAAATKKMGESITGGAINQAAANIDKITKSLNGGGSGAKIFADAIAKAKDQLSSLPAGSSSFGQLKDEIDAATKAFEQLNTGTKNPIDRLNELKATLESLRNAGLDQTQLFKALEGETNSLSNSIENASEEYKRLLQVIQLAKKQLSTLDEGTKEFDKLSSEIEAAEMAMGNFSQEATSSRAQLRQYREALIQLEEAGMEGTDVFNELALSAAQLEDQIGDTQARIRTLASDTFKFDAAIQAVQGVAGAFSIAQGATALFGKESEDVQRALLKVTAAMSVLNGLQQLQNILQRQSAATLFVENALRRISAASTVLQSLAESRFVIVRVAATAAQNALNAAMAANPAGVLLLAISAAAGALLLFSNNSEEAADSQEKLADASQKVIEVLNEEIEIQERLRNTRAGGLNTIRQEIAELQARGAARSKILALEQRAIDEEIQNLRIRQQTLAGLSKSEEDYNNVSDQIAKLRSDRALKSLEEQKAIQDESLRSAAAFSEARVAQAAKGTQEELDAQIRAIEARRAVELSDSAITAGQRAKIVADSERQIQDIRDNFQREQFNQQVSRMQSESALTTDLAKKLELDRAAVILKAQADSIGKSKDQQIIIENQKQAQLRQIDNDATVAILSNRLALYQAAAINEKDDAVKAQLEKEAIIVQAQIDSVGKTASEVLRIEKKKQDDITAIDLEAERKRGEMQLILLRRQAIGEKNELKLLENEKQELILRAQIDSAGKSKDERLAIEEQLKNDILDITHREEEEKKRIRQQALDAYVQLATSLGQSISEISRNNADAQIQALQTQLEQGLITQEQFDQKSRAIRRRAAQEEKQFAIFQATINAAAAIVKVFQTTGPPLSFILAATTAAATLAQIAAIQSKPIPAFAKGTKNAPGGLSLIGEAGPELYHANGKWGYANKATLLDLPKGAKVIPTLETEKILQKYQIPVPNVPNISTTQAGMKIDYNKLGSVIGREIGKLPLQVNSWDGNGFNKYQTSISSRRAHLNTKFSSK